MTGWALGIALLATGFSVGVLGSFFGVGGGFLLTPALNILGMEMLQAVGTSLLCVTGMSGMSLAGQLRRGAVQLSGGLALGLPAAVGSYFGKRIAETLASVGQAQTVILWCSVVLLLGVAARMRSPRSLVTEGAEQLWLRRWTARPHVRLGDHRFSLWAVAPVGAAIGVLSGLMGVGGGVIILPILLQGFGLTPAAAVGVSLSCVLLSGAYGGAAYYLSGRVVFWQVALMLAGTWPGTLLGARANAALGGERLIRHFARLTLLSAAGVVMKLVGWELGSALVVYGGLMGMPAIILVQYFRREGASGVWKRAEPLGEDRRGAQTHRRTPGSGGMSRKYQE